MGLFLTLLYIFTAYLGPQTIFGSLAEYHIELVIAFLALIASVPSFQFSGLSRLPQTYAVIGMCCAVFISFVLNGLASFAPNALFDFLPSSFAFFLIVLNCRKKGHLQMVILALLAASLFTIYRGYSAIRAGDVLSPYLLSQGIDAGDTIYRLRGLSFINDPNDFSQLIVSLIPCLFFFWRPKNSLRNLLFLYTPIGVLLFGMFLTHSRGAIIALLAVVIIAVRRRIGTVPSLIIAGALFAIFTAVGWSGGREISVGAGADRMEAWSTGLQLLKSHPLFGVGFQRFSEYFVITAHNSIVVCAAELGMFGLFFWVMFVVPTLRDAVVASAVPKSSKEILQEQEEKSPFELALAARGAGATNMVNDRPTILAIEPAMDQHIQGLYSGHHLAEADTNNLLDPQNTSQLSEAEIHRLARLLMIALSGFLVAGWFLSRAYVMTLFIYGGMVEVIYRIALDQGVVPARMEFSKALRLSAVSAVALIIIVYIMLRLQHLMPGVG